MQDRLQPLISSGKIRRNLLMSWKDVRHKNVHGSSFSSRDFDDDQLQKVLLQIRSVTVLIYEIIFHIIGYEESYTDYSILGWPTRSLCTEAVIG